MPDTGRESLTWGEVEGLSRWMASLRGCEDLPRWPRPDVRWGLAFWERVNVTVWSAGLKNSLTKPGQSSLAIWVSLFKGLQLGGEDVILSGVSSSGIWLFLQFGGGSLTPSPKAQGTGVASPLWLCPHSCSRQHFRLRPVCGTCSVDEGLTRDQVRRDPSSPLPSPQRREGDTWVDWRVPGRGGWGWGSWLRWGNRA